VKRVTGIGGIFFKSPDAPRLSAWYEKHLGLKADQGCVIFKWREREADANGSTVWSIFPGNTKYFDPSPNPFMVNYRVENLDGLLETLKAEGVTVAPERENSEYGQFAWIIDPDGNRIELWEPPKGQ
jgi:predicted enzyme related to lactoylglutathione lyase